VVEVVVEPVPSPDPWRVVVVVDEAGPVPDPWLVLVVVEVDDTLVVLVDPLGAGGAVVALGEVTGRVVGGAVVVVVVVAVVVVVVETAPIDPRQIPGTIQVFPPPPLLPLEAAPVLSGGYRSQREPNPMKATTINSVDRRTGSHRWTGTDMNPTSALCFGSASSWAAPAEPGALNPLGIGLRTVGLTSVSSNESVTGPALRSKGR
jgi:hypothetical protein